MITRAEKLQTFNQTLCAHRATLLKLFPAATAEQIERATNRPSTALFTKGTAPLPIYIDYLDL
ncbi:hypothetical protein A2276_04020 [candidate division WOR-1 bacterium RIFOXYA12_FULL_43_27]|uniref:Uncharacterized protein n=1 Tax=candidate division WOR-1 bacterium RIFOXYC2_FULL_46_14 TaxID=1802587 RepID=A0A1F4U8W8_UNCSA|nr:MAG: hypothetical protein A2276_04020 [candidate division WOR-1 bacterium RIFOXYA12_FULL_43_27]OGC19143.1 MAG: hypothetical protein A2292_00315 [candidate division WOR-1 bacterium RIFOXYB2_FULL_46_45]OGC30131.1 MAG: hypothetical protein A2232_00315 [candidate division WOR-1 bacterium RIFOXYA2_FULL_46_56]OGC40733.1 MAG: hypothetical protein A2438_00320 [candidate division WOR-1 bacterium RIFOXYC2_FULL_46_14]